jgi:phosphoadenosine phosphosulfate reductase
MSAISLYAKPSATFEQKLAASKALLISAAAQFGATSQANGFEPLLTQASSLGAEDMVVTHLIAETGIASSIFVLDTRMLHAETLALIDKLESRYKVKVDVYQPDAAVAEQFVATNGKDAMYKSLELRKACCNFRKMVPLAQALAGKKAWITGLRREQSDARAEVHAIEPGDGSASSRAKINPLADWTNGDVWHFIATHNIPYNPLHDQFFPSIGCAPCTRAVTLGEDFRSGRWWWENQDGASAKECGLHVEPPAFESLSNIKITQVLA